MKFYLKHNKLAKFSVKMSHVINEKELEDKKEEICPDFVEYKQPVNHRKIIIKKRHDINITDDSSPDLGKRKLCDSFSSQIYNDKDRYGQDIPTDFFNTNIGHNVYDRSQLDEAEILDWCYKYLASKNK